MQCRLTALIAGFLPVLIACGGGGGGSAPNLTPGVLDQSSVSNPADLIAGLGPGDRAQTFTVGATGILTHVEVLLEPDAGMGLVRVDVRVLNGTTPQEDDSVVLGSAEVNVGTLAPGPTFVAFDLAAAQISVAVGQQLAIVIRRVFGNGNIARVHGKAGMNPYATGAAFYRPTGGAWGAMAVGDDLDFRTYVRP